MLKASVLALLVAPAASLQLPQVSRGGRASAGVPTASLERRSVLQVFGAAAALALPAAAFADTLAELDEPMKGFGADVTCGDVSALSCSSLRLLGCACDGCSGD